MTPSISIIVPVYNSEKWMEKSIRTLLKQDLRDIEIIIVNDASTDASHDIILRLMAESKNIIYVNLVENVGVHEARLAGMKRSSAPWIGFMDADDYARSNMYSAMLKAGEYQEVDIVICGSQRVDPSRKSIAPKVKFSKSEKIDTEIFERFCSLEFGTGTLWNKLFKREVIFPYFDMHFPWRQNTNEDMLINIGCFVRASSIYLMEDVLHEYVVNTSSATSNMDNSKAFVDLYCAYAIAVSYFCRNSNKYLYSIANLYRNRLSWSSCTISDVSNVSGYHARLVAAAELIANANPLALSLIASRTPLPFSTPKGMVLFLAKKFYSRLKGW